MKNENIIINEDDQTVTLPITIDNARQIINLVGENNELYEAILNVYAGQPLSELPFDSWSQHWPLINPDLTLTGGWVDSDTDGWYNYNDEAAIWDDDAIAAGWQIDSPDDGYASPQEAHNG